MSFTEIIPSLSLQPFVKSLYYYQSGSADTFSDIVFPSGQMELIFNLGEGRWHTQQDDAFFQTPDIEVWGQITKPLQIRSTGRNTMLGIRFHAYSAAYFFEQDLSLLANEVVDAVHLFGESIRTLHAKLIDAPALEKRLALVESYLFARQPVTAKHHQKLGIVKSIADSLHGGSEQKIQRLSAQHNISSRYLNRLFSQYTGVAPKLFSKISRFQQGLNLVNSNTQSLTGVAYDAGYFDQSHFIREFKSFTGITPSSFVARSLPINDLIIKN